MNNTQRDDERTSSIRLQGGSSQDSQSGRASTGPARAQGQGSYQDDSSSGRGVNRDSSSGDRQDEDRSRADDSFGDRDSSR